MARKSRKKTDVVPPQDKANSILRTAAYVRLSAIDRKQKGDSIETQQAIINAFVFDYPELEIVETYIDNGISGQTFERPAFQRMIADIESGKITCCITKDLSRLGRNAIDAGYYIEKYFPLHNVRFIAITDNYDSANSRNNGLMVNLKNIINEAFAIEVGRKIRATKQMNIRDGCFVGRISPYGYLKSQEDKHKLVIDPVAAKNVQKIFQMSVDGKSASDILKHLNNSEILPPFRYFYSKGLVSEKEANGHRHWNKSVIYSILHNRIYCGDMVQGKYKNIDHIEKMLPESEWIITENTHEGIISRELFWEVQKRWEGKKELHKKRKPYSKNIFLHKIFCGHCEHTMFRQRSGKNQYIFLCNTRRSYDKSDCTLVSINENILKQELFIILRKQAEVFADVQKSVKPIKAENTELRNVQSEISRNNHFLKSLYESLVNRDISADEFKEMKATYEARITALAELEKQLNADEWERNVREAERIRANNSLRRLHSISDLTADVIDWLIEKILVFEDKHIEVQFRFTDETIPNNTANISKQDDSKGVLASPREEVLTHE